MRQILPGVVAVVALLGVVAASPAWGLDHGVCADYAQKAVRQFELRQGRVCGQDPDNRSEWWSPDEGYHYRWCRGITHAGLIADGLKKRDAVIDRCKARLTDADCNRYAEAAAQQNRDRLQLGCSSNIGRSEMWNSDPGYHLRWCRGLTDKGPLEAGQAARSEVLYRCGPTAPADLKCDDRFGLREPRQVRKYFSPAKPPSEGGMATCIYDFGNGEEIRVDAKWRQSVRWTVTLPVSIGCDPASAGIGAMRSTEAGLSQSSAKFHASASVSGNSPDMQGLARAAHGALTQMFVLAETNALPCQR